MHTIFFFSPKKNNGVSRAGKLSRRGGTQIDQFGKEDPNDTTLCKKFRSKKLRSKGNLQKR